MADRQARAVRREFEEALEDKAWELAADILDANPDVFTADDSQRFLAKVKLGLWS